MTTYLARQRKGDKKLFHREAGSKDSPTIVQNGNAYEEGIGGADPSTRM